MTPNIPEFQDVEKISEALAQYGGEYIQMMGCNTCKNFSWGVKTFLDNMLFKSISSDIGVQGCKYILPMFSPYKAETCPGIIDQQWNQALFPIIFEMLLSELDLCTFILEVCPNDKWEKTDTEEFVFNKVNEKSDELRKNNFVQNLYDKMEKKDKKDLIPVVLMSDLHMDYGYQEGMSNNCFKPLCCRAESGLPTKDSERAAKWGDYNCDLSPIAMRATLDFIKEEMKP